MEKYLTYEQLTAFEKCVMNEHAVYYAGHTKMALPTLPNGNVRRDDLVAALKDVRDITLAVGGINNVIDTINTPGHPEAPILTRCAQQHTPLRSTPANAR